MKTCPYCGEEIQDKAIKCKHCGEWLDKSEMRKRKIESTKEFIKPLSESTEKIVKNTALWGQVLSIILLITTGVSMLSTVAFFSEKIDLESVYRKCDTTKYTTIDTTPYGSKNYQSDRIKLPQTLEQINSSKACMKTEMSSRSLWMIPFIILILLEIAAVFSFIRKFRNSEIQFLDTLTSFWTYSKPIGRIEYIGLFLGICGLSVGIYVFSGGGLFNTTGFLLSKSLLVIFFLYFSVKRGRDLGNVSTGTSLVYNIFPFINIAITPVYLFGRSGSVNGERFYEGKNKILMIGGISIAIITTILLMI